MSNLCEALAEWLKSVDWSESENGHIQIYLPLSDSLTEGAPYVHVKISKEAFDCIKAGRP